MDTPPRKDRTWLYVGGLFLAFWAVYLTFFLPKTAPEGLPVPRLEASAETLPADYGWALEDLDGKPVPFGDFANKLVVLNLWASWCGPCRGEMPGLVRLAENPQLKHVAFVAVTTEAASDIVRKVGQDELRGWRVLRSDPGKLPEVFDTDVIPATFVIAPGGGVVASEIGSARWDDPSVVEFLEKLAKPAPAPAAKP
jgi:thiol-disulfide isomerase/thioredoxin